MDKQKRKTTSIPKSHVPQLQVRSRVVAGYSVEACLRNLNYWRDQYYKMCGRR